MYVDRHHQDALVAGLVGLLCGVVVGCAYMGFLAPATSGEHAADWFSGLGTWVVGIAAAALTIQWNRSTALREKQRHEHQAQEDRLRHEAAQRDAAMSRRRQAIEELTIWNKYRQTLATLNLPSEMTGIHSPRLGLMTAAEGLDLVSSIVSTLPKGEINHFFLLSSDEMVGKIAALEVALNSCRTLSETFIARTHVPPPPLDAMPMYEHSQKFLRQLMESAKAMAEMADELGQATDQLRPFVPDVP
ncbi:hypothetical protein B7H27_11835 [Stenotrophomonas maltophilia]|nr:hypothetical protein B7H27_11835 [Stenotrophomonas maltophilia]